MTEHRPKFEIIHELSRSDDANDEAVLAHLRAAGSDLTKQTDVVFYLYIPAIEDAHAAASELKKNGYAADVHEPLGLLPDGSYESRYSVIAHIQEAPSLPFIRKARRLYQSLARHYKGEYDGWEAMVAN